MLFQRSRPKPLPPDPNCQQTGAAPCVIRNHRTHNGVHKFMSTQKTGLVVTAHPGDFVWRAGGAIALHAKRGYRIKIACLSLGERGESQFAWKEQGATLATVKAGRKDEAERAASLLGAEIEFFDCGDYPLD